MRSGGCVLLTAINAISSARCPERLAAAANRSRTSAMFSEIGIINPNHEGHEVPRRGALNSLRVTELALSEAEGCPSWFTHLHDRGWGRRIFRTSTAGEWQADHDNRQHGERAQ